MVKMECGRACVCACVRVSTLPSLCLSLSPDVGGEGQLQMVVIPPLTPTGRERLRQRRRKKEKGKINEACEEQKDGEMAKLREGEGAIKGSKEASVVSTVAVLHTSPCLRGCAVEKNQ